jgi:prepilin-type N-terminal cleavage/methylation domain-containing protein
MNSLLAGAGAARARLPRGGMPRGFTLLEVLVVGTILVLIVAVGVPALAELNGQMTIRAASLTIASTLHEARMRALFTRSNVGVKFDTSGGDVVVTVYQDGNDNGVLSADIRSGIDKPLGPPVSMRKRFGKIPFSFLPGLLAPDPSGAPLGDLNDPIRFGASNICSFSPDGSCSPGSVYLSDSRGRQEVLRIHPLMSRVAVLEYRPGTKKWERLY